FQAEDGIRDATVTGVQTCALPIYPDCIDLRVNVPMAELRTWYAKAAVFWHACGLDEREPHLIEHFGMTTVEAMQNRCAPVVFDEIGRASCRVSGCICGAAIRVESA